MSGKDLDTAAQNTQKVTDEKAAEPEMSVEEAFARLDTLIEELEKPDQTLEASFSSYAEGMKLVQFCNAALDEVEKKVLVLSRDGEVDEF